MATSKHKPVKKQWTAAAFDRAFDRGEGFEALNLNTAAVRSSLQRIQIGIPKQIVRRIDHEAHRAGVSRTSIIKIWIVEKLQELKSA